MLDVKALLTKLLGRVGNEYFTLTGYAGVDESVGDGWYDKSTDTVRLYMYGRDSANIPNGTVFTVPAGYRPSDNIGAPMTFQTASAAGTHFLTVHADGTVTQNASSSLRSFSAYCEYKLGGVVRQLLSALTSGRGWAMC